MDNAKIGRLIYSLRKENNMTQLQLASLLNVSDKAVSKWERGLGRPDLSLLPQLSKIFNVDIEKLLSGQLDANKALAGNMRKTQFYVCPVCGNIITAMADANITCCGKKLTALPLQKADEAQYLDIEKIENEYFVSSDHPMERQHYISFVALLSADGVILRKLYPQWDLQCRLPFVRRARLVWYCTQHGLFYQEIKI